MIFSSDFIDRVRNSNNIVDIIERYTELKRMGGRLKGLCPFPHHNEKTPSFFVSEERQLYHCFGCKKSGNIYQFLGELQAMSFPEAVEYLAGRAGIPLPVKFEGDSDRDGDSKKQAWEMNKAVAQFFHKNLLSLPANHFVKEYCSSRGISDEMVKEFYIGYAPGKWEALSQYLQKNNHSLQVASSVGLVKERTKGGKGVYDLFRDRLMFPIIGRADRYVGFGGRIFEEGQPKYLNSPESFVFQKGKVLYGLNWTAKYIRTESYAIVVEGYMDFLALQKAGIKNVVATLGTALTEGHSRQLRRLTQKVVVLFDGDRAGQEASQRSLPLLLGQGIHPRVCVLDRGQDPDDFLKSEGVEALKTAVRASRDLFLYNLERIISEVGIKEVSDKVLVLDQLMSIYTHIVDVRLKDLYLTEISRRLGVEKNWVRKGLQGDKPHRLQPSLKKPISQGEGEEVFVLRGAPREEIYLLNLALMSEEQFVAIRDRGVVEQLSHSGVCEIFEFAILKYRQNSSKFDNLTALLASKVDRPREVSRYLEGPISELDNGGVQKLLEDCCQRVSEKFMKAQTKELSLLLKSQTTTEQLEQLERIMNIHRDRHRLKGHLDSSQGPESREIDG